MVALTHFPLGLIPLWAVPMMLPMHAELFRRLWTRAPVNGAAPAGATVDQPAAR